MRVLYPNQLDYRGLHAAWLIFGKYRVVSLCHNRCDSAKNAIDKFNQEIAWPSGLRRQLKALVRKGVGSNPTAVILYFFQCVFIVLI